MTLFNERAIMEGAALNPAAAPPASFGERTEIEWRTFRDQQMLDSDTVAIDSAYDAYAEELESLTGKRLPTPSERMTQRGGNPGFAKRSRADAHLLDLSRKEFDNDLQALAQDFPEIPIRTREDILAGIGVDRAQQRQQQAETQARTVDPLVSVAGFGATAAAAVTEPLVIGSLAFGAPAASGILRTALVEGAIGAAVEVPIQVGVQSARRQFGEEPSFSEGLQAVLAAGGGGFLFGGLIKAAVRAPGGVRALLERSKQLPAEQRTADVKAAEGFLERAIEAEDARPFPDTPEGKAAHLERLDAADKALRTEGRAADLGPAPQRAPVQPTDVADALPVAAAARSAAIQRQDLDQQARGVAEALGPLVDDAAGLEAVLRDVQAKPVKTEGLLSFLQRTGGVVDEAGELSALGMTSRTRPGLLRREGRSLDDAALAAQQEGFFPGRDLEAGDRVTVRDFLDAVDRELRGERVLRAGDEAVEFNNQAIEQLREGLASAGIDTRRMTPEKFRQAVRELVQEIGARDRGAELTNMGRAGADAADIEERAAMMSEEDLLDEGDVLRAYEGREDEVIAIEDENGVRRLTVRQMLDEAKRDEDDFAALQVCVGGSRG